MSSLTSATPCGRNELLGWINTLCGAEYPTIEALRDGAGYCTVIEAAAIRFQRNCAAAGFPDWNNATEKAVVAKRLLSRVDWSATSHVYEVVDPGQDTAFYRHICLKNLSVLQRMIRECLIPDYSTEIHPDRLASGKLQDHLHFLSWLWNYIRKILTGYTKSEILKKALGRTSVVEGVKTNRAMKLLQEKRIGVSQRGNTGIERTSPPLISPRGRTGMGAVNPRSSRSSTGTAGDTRTNVSQGTSPPTTASHSPRERRRNEITKSGSPPTQNCFPLPSKDNSPENVYLPYPNSSSGTESQSIPHSSFSNTHTMKAYLRKNEENIDYILVPSSFKDRAVELRKLVEELEQLVLREHNDYQNSITSSSHKNDNGTAEEKDNDSTQIPRIPSLVSLGKLLEERDALAQIYEKIENTYQSAVKRWISTPLVMHLGAVLYPPRKL